MQTVQIPNRLINLLEDYDVNGIQTHSTELSLFYDYGIVGDDAVDFFCEFVNIFNLELGEFSIFNYFPKEHDWAISKNVFDKKHLTVLHLCQFIEYGCLSDELT